MEDNDNVLSQTGPMPRPKDLAEAREILKREAFPAPDIQVVTMEATEFTSLCPRSGQPDFGEVSIEYVPDAHCLESRALKFYLWAYRNEGAFCETLAAQIADDIVAAIAPKAVRVEVHQNVRGGIRIMAVEGRPTE